MNYFQIISDTGYVITIPVVAFLLFFAKQKKIFLKEWMNCCNLLYWIFTLIQIAYTGFTIAEVYYSAYYNQGEFVTMRWNWELTNSFHFWLSIVLILSVAIFFSFKKFRSSIPTSLSIWALLLLQSFLLKIIVVITSLYRDYLPSSWSTSYSRLDYILYFLSPVIFNLMTLIIYYTRQKLRNRRMSDYFN